MMLELAKANGISAVTMARCLEFTRMRDEAGIESQVWDGSKLSFTLASSLDSGHSLSVLLPRNFAGKRLAEVTVDDRPVQVSAKTFKGREHVAVLVKSGLRSAVTARYEIQAGPGSR